MKDKTIKIEHEVWEIITRLRKQQGRTLKGMLRYLAEKEDK